MAWAAGQSGVGPSVRRSGGQMECGGSQPVLRCPDHPHRRVALLTSKTDRNIGRRFYRCIHGYKRRDACSFFLWEDKLDEYLLQIGQHDGYTSSSCNESSGQPEEKAPQERIAMLDGTVFELRGAIEEINNNVVEIRAVSEGSKYLLGSKTERTVVLGADAERIALFVAMLVAIFVALFVCVYVALYK
ncbi:hypothetical protein ACP4OV_010611 [Aristida adscensionis]